MKSLNRSSQYSQAKGHLCVTKIQCTMHTILFEAQFWGWEAQKADSITQSEIMKSCLETIVVVCSFPSAFRSVLILFTAHWLQPIAALILDLCYISRFPRHPPVHHSLDNLAQFWLPTNTLINSPSLDHFQKARYMCYAIFYSHSLKLKNYLIIS